MGLAALTHPKIHDFGFYDYLLRHLPSGCREGGEGGSGPTLARLPRWPIARPGFLTVQVSGGAPLTGDFDLESVFARSWGFSLGKLAGDDPQGVAAWSGSLWGDRPIMRIHAWPRDICEPGEHGFEPAITPAAVAAYEALRQACPRPGMLARGNTTSSNRPGPAIGCSIACSATRGMVDRLAPRRRHAFAVAGRSDGPRNAGGRGEPRVAQNGGGPPLVAIAHPAGGPLCGDRRAPAGPARPFLARGVEVLGIDPAEMDPAVVALPGFRHIRRRIAEVPRREFRKIRWLTADMNVAPAYTLDAVEAVVAHPEVNIRGMILTLKLLEWTLARQVPEYLDRVRGWGYNIVHARQLQHDRREFCLAALQRPFRRKGISGRKGP